jgi:hypothetical protein
MNKTLLHKIIKLFRKPPGVVIRRLFNEASDQAERFLAGRRAQSLDEHTLLKKLGFSDLNTLWNFLGEKPFPALVKKENLRNCDQLCPGERERILKTAVAALAHRVDLLGSGPVSLGNKINWHCDYKTGIEWNPAFFKDIEYNNPERPSDVKFPWEVSRMQWLIPVGQLYLLTGDEEAALAVRNLLEDWMGENPYSRSVNWACTMEAAMRIFTWTWFFHVFQSSLAWKDRKFRSRFLSSLYLHGDFVERHLELSEINGNHCTADAAALVFAGLFFGKGKAPERWRETGWKILNQELARQVYPDGVDFEASIPYHRLVQELFLFPALYRESHGLEVPGFYRDRVVAMARFTAFYSRNDGTAPLWGDADDARVLPFGGQNINDHRYLTGMLGAAWKVSDLIECFSGSRSEIFWTLGPEAFSVLPVADHHPSILKSRAFPDGGFYVMRNQTDHVFIDCGPVGLAGRGGHGHNDCLSFEAVLDGVQLVTDCGAYLYTASYQERNRFRSTAYHNTPQINGDEINRLLSPENLWNLHYDAIPEVRRWETGPTMDIFTGTHTGYRRLVPPVKLERTIVLNHAKHVLTVEDRFQGEGEHMVSIPLHLAPGVEVNGLQLGRLRLQSSGRVFTLSWENPSKWELEIGNGRVSPSYGKVVSTVRLIWKRSGPVNCILKIELAPL